MMYSAPEVWHILMDKLAGLLSDYLLAQIGAGAQAVHQGLYAVAAFTWDSAAATSFRSGTTGMS